MGTVPMSQVVRLRIYVLFGHHGRVATFLHQEVERTLVPCVTIEQNRIENGTG